MIPHLLYVGGEDHHLRIPFMLSMRDCGFRVTAAGSGDSTPFRWAGLDFRPFHFNRYVSPLADRTAVKALSTMLRDLYPDLAQSYDTKPNLLLPLAARAAGHPGIVRTISGLGWVYSSRSPLALFARPCIARAHRAAARSTAATVFEIHDDQAFFERHRMTGKNGLVIPAGGGGVDVEGFGRALAESPPAAQLREELGLGTSPVIITVTRMTRGKGFRRCSRQRRWSIGLGRMFVSCWSDPVKARARLRSRKPRSTSMPPMSSPLDLDPMCRRCSASPTSLRFQRRMREGVPRVLLEAALAGVPIVSTSMPGCCEVIRDGWNGFLVPPHAPDRLAARIIDLLRDRKTAGMMAGRAEELVAQKFSLRMIVARHVALYAELLARNSRLGMGELDSTQLAHQDASHPGQRAAL